jgi:hypothetical protein
VQSQVRESVRDVNLDRYGSAVYSVKRRRRNASEHDHPQFQKPGVTGSILEEGRENLRPQAEDSAHT